MPPRHRNGANSILHKFSRVLLGQQTNKIKPIYSTKKKIEKASSYKVPKKMREEEYSG